MSVQAPRPPQDFGPCEREDFVRSGAGGVRAPRSGRTSAATALAAVYLVSITLVWLARLFGGRF